MLQGLCDNLTLQGIDAISLKYDTHYRIAKDIAEIEDRIILTTRFRRIFQKENVIYITEKKLEEQVKEAFWYLNVKQDNKKK